MTLSPGRRALALLAVMGFGCDDTSSSDGGGPAVALDLGMRPTVGDVGPDAPDVPPLALLDFGAPRGDAGPGADAVPPGTDAAPPNAQGCTSVDVLVVLDSSGSMVDNQVSVAASVPGFIQKLRERLSFSRSYHLGLTTTSDYPWNAPGCTAIGDLVTQTGGPEALGEVCTPFADGQRFLTEREPDLVDSFDCIARVGAGGADDERMMRAMLDAVSPEKNGPGGCNEGFLRPDSLLVLILLTDEDDVPDLCDGDGVCQTYGSGGDKQAWYDELVAARGGTAEGIVVISILGRRGDNACGAVPAAKLIGFTGLFGENGYLGDICAEQYDTVFDEALPVVVDACSKR
ncbi:MAG: hypothetical protein ACOYM9_22645 [Bradymonadia bacterium]|jgi:hypothetical protein